eukprot:GEMP01018206.1.p1 GENE.GEMP01018206.1~~GEMP01018206.1.p1  ORF type:complete len:450 (+),score=92.94 GEMP01018206.1:194-1543(+)
MWRRGGLSATATLHASKRHLFRALPSLHARALPVPASAWHHERSAARCITAAPVCTRGMATSSRASASDGSTPVEISIKRFEELLMAEVINLAENYREISFSHGLMNIISMQQEPMNRLYNARKLSTDISTHFGFRVHLLNNVDIDNECFQKLCNIYLDSFTHMQTQIPHIPEEGDLEEFDKVMLDLRQRHLNVVPLLVTSISDELDYEKIKSFLDHFFRSRIYTEMMTRQYFAAGSGMSGDNDLFPPQRPLGGGYDSGLACDALVRDLVCAAMERAVSHIGSNYDGSVNVNLSYELDGNVDVRARTLGEYVYFIIFELAKNAFLATCHQDANKRRPVLVTMSENDELVIVRIRDHGIGILKEHALTDIWRFGYTTADLQAAGDGTLHKHSVPARYRRSPMAGVGCGLPLAKKYSWFLGGNLELMSVPHYGCDAYFTFRKDVTENIKEN